MRFSEQWLREWVNPNLNSAQLGAQLTMAGLELDALEPAAPAFAGVFVAKILEAVQHPDADKLRICQVDDGTGAERPPCRGHGREDALRGSSPLLGLCSP